MGGGGGEDGGQQPIDKSSPSLVAGLTPSIDTGAFLSPFAQRWRGLSSVVVENYCALILMVTFMTAGLVQTRRSRDLIAAPSDVWLYGLGVQQGLTH